MLIIYKNLIPVFAFFFLGVILKYFNILNEKHGEKMLKSVFYFTLPPLVFVSVFKLELTRKLFIIPSGGLITVLVSYFIGLFIIKRLKLDNKTSGTFISGSTTMNLGFVIPFILSVYGEKGLAIMSLFDLGNAFITFSLIYITAVKFGNGNVNNGFIIRKIIIIPPMWGLFAALFIKYIEYFPGDIILNIMGKTGKLTSPLIMISLGIFLNLKISDLRLVLFSQFTRILCGLMTVLIFINIFEFSELIKKILIISSLAPSGFSTIVFSSIEDLNRELAVSIVSVSIILGILYFPVILYLFSL